MKQRQKKSVFLKQFIFLFVCSQVFFLQQAQAQVFPIDCPKASSATQPIPLEIEGVYDIKIQADEVLNLSMTLLKNLDSERLSLTFAVVNSNRIIFSLSCINLQKVSLNTYKIEAAGLNFSGARVLVSLEFNTFEMTMSGELSGNFLRNDRPLKLSGSKSSSIYEILKSSTGVACDSQDNIFGTYTGFFGEKRPAQLNVFKFIKADGTQGISGNILSSLNILYHDGQFSSSENVLSLVNNYSRSFGGQSKKLMLVCEKDAQNLIMHGLHFSSTGAVLRNITFKKAR